MALTTLPTWTTKPVTAPDLTTMVNGISELRPILARKTLDETVNNTSTLQNDNHMSASVIANAVYEMRMRAIVNGGTTPDIKFGWTYPVGLTMSVHFFEGSTPSTAASVLQGPGIETTVPAFSTIAADQIIIIEGLVIVGANAGTLQLQWAQNVATASNTTVKINSYLLLRRLS